MWKIALGFVVFAGLALFILMKSGGDIDMSGEKHGAEATHAEPAKAAPAAASAPAAAAPASAASQ
ncbi:hypothetical protein RQP54_18880 [Curvibacter sp. APW13]|uniref:hypothetical protein n=1 Tax=Curvibacter sp. APW13 TaxID=3077236 RepID=UPI0028DDF942|nr:hypothetical protein [Curvibacter sp. APW13]MDT8992947.1 hypothetical protein [Curvibacter sp. APW13]